MITRFDLFPILHNEFPLLRAELALVNDRKSPYQALRCFADYTLRSICANGPSRHSGKCLDFAERCLADGDGAVRAALEFVFAAGFGSCPDTMWQFVILNAPCLAGQMRETGISPSPSEKFRA